MYDENQIEDSLEFCRQIDIYYKTGEEKKAADDVELTTEKLFADMSTAIDTIGSTKPWEKVMSELDYDMSTTEVEASVVNPASAVSVESTSLIIKILSNLLILLVCVGIAFSLASFVVKYVAHQTTVEGISMEPTLSNGDSLIIQKLSYIWGKPQRFDVVVFPVDNVSGDGEVDYYIKRIIGLPGETVLIRNGKVYINGSELKDDIYGAAEILDSGIAKEDVDLGDDEYFVLGDNRNMSTDSRSVDVGVIDGDDIEGEAWCCIWPFSHIGKVL